MTIRRLGDREPVVAPTAWVSETAYLVGDVTIGEGSSVWPGAVVRGDFGAISIGRRTHVEDNVVVHSADATVIGDDTIVGHGAVVHARSVGDHCLIGTHATVLEDVEIGAWCTVAAGALLQPGTIVPTRSFVVGLPATVRPATDRQLKRLREIAKEQPIHGYGAMMLEYRRSGL